MIEITIQVPDDLARRIEPMSDWLPSVLALSLIGFKTRAVETASEIIAFLETGPSASEVLDHHVSERAQQRLKRLLALNTAGELAPDERDELEELERIEHTMVMLKAGLTSGERVQ